MSCAAMINLFSPYVLKDLVRMPVNFDLNDLYAFRALLEYGNFGRVYLPFPVGTESQN